MHKGRRRDWVLKRKTDGANLQVNGSKKIESWPAGCVHFITESIVSCGWILLGHRSGAFEKVGLDLDLPQKAISTARLFTRSRSR
jgi:hypothetical protein